MPQVEMEKVEPRLEPYEDQPTNLIPILQEVQEQYRYRPQEVLRKISRKLRVSLTEVFQVATPYRCFSLVPRGKHVVQVCLGTASRCAARVLDRMLRDLKLANAGTTEDLQFTVETVRCIGCCGLAPVARVDNTNTHPHLTQAKVGGCSGNTRKRRRHRKLPSRTRRAMLKLKSPHEIKELQLCLEASENDPALPFGLCEQVARLLELTTFCNPCTARSRSAGCKVPST